MAAADSQGPPSPDLADSMPLVYDELKRIAAHYLRGEMHRTLRPTELVHEAYVRIAGGRPRLIADKVHVLALLATAMRHILVDRARARDALKRGGGSIRVTLSEALPARGAHEDALGLEMAIERLHEVDPRAARAFVLSEYGGLTQVEIAAVLGVAERTVRDDLVHARAWLRDRLSEPQNGSGWG